MEDKRQRTPIIDPLLLALKSRRVIVAIVSIIVGILIVQIPDLGFFRDEITFLITAIALGVIGGISWEDAAKAGRETVPAENLEEAIREMVDAIIDETLGSNNNQTVG